jgi:hypothetical protein
VRPACLIVVAGCVTGAPQEDPSEWFDPGAPYDVQEAIAFTDVNYGFTGETALADLPVPGAFQTWFSPSDPPPSDDCADWSTDPGLPATITGIATILPRYYYKSNGCTPSPGDNDEKFYGSFFVQDATGGYFVLGDTKVAHFDAGDRVTLTVRAVRESYEQLMIPVYDRVEVVRGPEPIYYEAVPAGALGPEHVSRVVRVEGTVATDATTFGEVYLDADDGTRHKFSLDVELNRRGIGYPVGARLQVTGPVLYSFSEYTIVVMRIGQLTEL